MGNSRKQKDVKAEPAEEATVSYQLNEAQKEEFFRENISMILDANRIYQRKTAAMHKEIFELEEVNKYIKPFFYPIFIKY